MDMNIPWTVDDRVAEGSPESHVVISDSRNWIAALVPFAPSEGVPEDRARTIAENICHAVNHHYEQA